MKYINKFSTNADYQAFTDGDDYVTPNVCYVDETDGIVMKQYIAPVLFTFVFNDYGNIKTFQAENGMTWDEWADSKYNTVDYIQRAGGYIHCGGESFICNEEDNISTRVLGSEQIIPNKTYYGVSSSPV